MTADEDNGGICATSSNTAPADQLCSPIRTNDRRRSVKHRDRAPHACEACRKNRLRCIMDSDGSGCNHCRSTDSACCIIINDSDERRKPYPKAYIRSLNDKIATLERALKMQSRENGSTSVRAHTCESEPPLQPCLPEHYQMFDITTPTAAPTSTSSNSDSGSPASTLSIMKDDSMVSKLLSTRGHLSFDQLSGRLRYFGSTTNCHVHWAINRQDETSFQAYEHQHRALGVLTSLASDTHDHLMDCFWQDYNPFMHVVCRIAFEAGRTHGTSPSYSLFLHVCILAMGFRTADKSRVDVMNMSLPYRESTIHKEAKSMLEHEIEQPSGIPTIVALLLLGDLECSAGRDNVGWLYAGMANRLCFDMGLHLDRSNSGLSDTELEVGRTTLLACLVYDRYWALFLGRPTGLKYSDLDVLSLSQNFGRLGTSATASTIKGLETEIYDSLLELMEIAGKITDIMGQTSHLGDDVTMNHHVYVQMASLNRELELWYKRLSKSLRWTEKNVQTAPFSFFLLHQQYHSTMILLHRPFADYSDAQTSSQDENVEVYVPRPNVHLSAMSKNMCTQHAVRVARIFLQHRRRFDTSKIFITGMQHAGTAATALIAALASVKEPGACQANMHHLECLATAIQDMGRTYLPAEKMSAVLQIVLTELKATLPDAQSIVSVRRESSVAVCLGSLVSQEGHRPSPVTYSSFEPRLKSPGSGMSDEQWMPWVTQGLDRGHEDSLFDCFLVPTPSSDSDALMRAWSVPSKNDASGAGTTIADQNTCHNYDFDALETAWMGWEPPTLPHTVANSFSGNISESLLFSEGPISAVPPINFYPAEISSLLTDDQRQHSDLQNKNRSSSISQRPNNSVHSPTEISSARARNIARGVSNLESDSTQSEPRTMAGLDDLWSQMRQSTKAQTWNEVSTDDCNHFP